MSLSKHKKNYVLNISGIERTTEFSVSSNTRDMYFVGKIQYPCIYFISFISPYLSKFDIVKEVRLLKYKPYRNTLFIITFKSLKCVCNVNFILTLYNMFFFDDSLWHVVGREKINSVRCLKINLDFLPERRYLKEEAFVSTLIYFLSNTKITFYLQKCL